MKARTKLATARTPDGCEMALYQHDRDFSIRVDGLELMNSRQHESELELARLGCAALTERKAPRVLVGGLGLGYTLRCALDMLPPRASVVVAELLPEVAEWNRTVFGDLNNHPLKDARVKLKTGDILKLISHTDNSYDAILLDVDNGPNAFTDAGNHRLYGPAGIKACRRALRKNGCLAIWSAESSKSFEHLLMRCRLHVRRYRVPAYKGSKSQSRFIWVASADKSVLPAGGGEPRAPKRRAKHSRKAAHKRR